MELKLQFEDDLDYQRDAINAVRDLFAGQESCQSEFSVTVGADELELGGDGFVTGVGNRIHLLPEELLANLQAVQKRNAILADSVLVSPDLTIEMETGTGKTYVYLRTIFELNKAYGWTKFIVVVPSVAIKEGVYKTVELTADHFAQLYAGARIHCFQYDSAKLGTIHNFSISSNIELMITTVGAINKRDFNKLYQESELLHGDKPIDRIRATRPVVIVDEPQSVGRGDMSKGWTAIQAMDPLCTLSYSATHVDKRHMVYRLDSVDAYDRKLVKQIEVTSAELADAHNDHYVRLLKVTAKRGSVTAKIEVNKRFGDKVRRAEVTVSGNETLDEITGLQVYRDCRIGEIRAEKGNESIDVSVPGEEHVLAEGEAIGDVDPLAIQTLMIRRTIEEHLDKELNLRPRGIKVLSLFFVDRVDRYRRYDADGRQIPGEFAEIFEREYRRIVKQPKYRPLFDGIDTTTDASEVHGGYFSTDRKSGHVVDSSEKPTAADRARDEETYNLIMKDKVKLLQLDNPLRFIFSHSALGEGWDNPNVFQICALRDVRSDTRRRQIVGRGLRLCVNQAGERVRGFDVNTLTVFATESFEDFAEKLQSEIEADTGIRFGYIGPESFATIVVAGADGTVEQLGSATSRMVHEHLREMGYVDARGKVQESLKQALKDGTLSLPASLEPHREAITAMAEKLSRNVPIKPREDRREINANKAVLDSSGFTELWDRIKYKTSYQVNFDNARLVDECAEALREAPPIPHATVNWRTGRLAVERSGIAAKQRGKGGSRTVRLDEPWSELPDLLGALQERTQLTRKSLCDIVLRSGRLNDFKVNPQKFIEVASKAINLCKSRIVVEGIKYERIGDEYYDARELFESAELTGYLRNMATGLAKSATDAIVVDSEVERRFVEELEADEAVEVYTKLPAKFTIPTPLGTYNPDWAVLASMDGVERLYFVVETKGSGFIDELRNAEKGKIACGRAHFRALSDDAGAVKYKVASKVADLFAHR